MADDCKNREKSSGQWTYIPKMIARKYGKPEWSCVCKKANCLRWAEVPGAPQLKRAKLNEPAVAVALKEADALPRPYALDKIDEIWGVRCASPACHSPPAPPSSPARCLASAALTPLACRYTDITKMEEVERGNKLPHNPSDALEYAVHGKWKRKPDDSNGIFGCWYISLKELMKTFKDDEEEDKHAFIRGKIVEFEKEQKEAREEAFEQHTYELEADEDSDGD